MRYEEEKAGDGGQENKDNQVMVGVHDATGGKGLVFNNTG
jgi:hypothetical protein